MSKYWICSVLKNLCRFNNKQQEKRKFLRRLAGRQINPLPGRCCVCVCAVCAVCVCVFVCVCVCVCMQRAVPRTDVRVCYCVRHHRPCVMLRKLKLTSSERNKNVFLHLPRNTFPLCRCNCLFSLSLCHRFKLLQGHRCMGSRPHPFQCRAGHRSNLLQGHLGRA